MKDIELSADLKVNDFLIKPILPQQLLSSLKKSGIMPRNTKKILIVNNDQELLLLCKNNLSQLGYHTDYTTNGESALKIVENNHPDLVIVDILMPGMDGFEFLRRFRENKMHEKNAGNCVYIKRFD